MFTREYVMARLALIRSDLVSGEGKIESIHITYRDDLLHVNIDGFAPRAAMRELGGLDPQEPLDVFREYLSADIGEPVVVELDIIPVDMVHLRSEPPELRTAEQ